MSTHLLGEKKLKKYSNKLGISFDIGYEHWHGQGYKIHILQMNISKFALLLKKNDILDLKKLPDDYDFWKHTIRISPDDKLYLLT